MKLCDDFRRKGVEPFKPNTEFSLALMFYLTNSLTTIFEFPLFNRLSSPPDDNVAVYQFEVEIQTLHGVQACPDGFSFKIRWFRDILDTKEWKHFCENNMYGPVPKDLHEYDLVIGPVCILNNMCSTVTPRHVDYTHIAFCTKWSWDWISSCVK